MREFKNILCLFSFFILFFGWSGGQVCLADEGDPSSHFGDFDGDGKLDMCITYQEGDFHYLVYIMGDGTSSVTKFYADPGNPNPDDPNSTGDGKNFDQIKTILKNKGGSAWTEMTQEQFYKTPLGKALLRGGRGPLPRWNPSEIYAEGPDGSGSGSGGFFTPNGGSIGDQIRHHQGSGNGDSADGDDPNKNEGSKRGIGTYDSDGILVNPKARVIK